MVFVTNIQKCSRHGRGKKSGRGGKRDVVMVGQQTSKMTRTKYMPGHWGMHGFNKF